MEFDLLVSHGSSSAIRNMIENSDMEMFRVCENCRHFPMEDSCNICSKYGYLEVDMPYAIKVLKDLLLINNINMCLD